MHIFVYNLKNILLSCHTYVLYYPISPKAIRFFKPWNQQLPPNPPIWLVPAPPLIPPTHTAPFIRRSMIIRSWAPMPSCPDAVASAPCSRIRAAAATLSLPLPRWRQRRNHPQDRPAAPSRRSCSRITRLFRQWVPISRCALPSPSIPVTLR